MQQYDLNIREMWRIIRKRKFIWLSSMVTMAVFSFFISALRQPVPIYKATATIRIDKSTDASALNLQIAAWSGADDFETRATTIMSFPLMEIVAKRLGLIDESVTSAEIRTNPVYLGVVLRLKGSVEAEREGLANIIAISAYDESPKLAQNIANTVAAVYREENTKQINRRNDEALAFIESQIQSVGEKLNQAEQDLIKFRETHKLVSLNAQTSHILNTLSRVEADYQKFVRARQEIEDLLVSLTQVQNKPLTAQQSFYSNEASTLYKNLNDKLVNLLVERDTLLLTYTQDYPEVRELGRRIAEVARNMHSQLSRQLDVQRKREAELKQSIDELSTRLQELPEEGLELARLERKVKLHDDIFTLLETKHQEALIRKSEKIEEVSLVRPALEPTSPVRHSSQAMNVILGAVIGLIIGIMLVWLVETFDTSIGAIEDVEEFTGVKVIGIVPFLDVKEFKERVQEIRGEEDVSKRDLERASRMVAHFSPKSVQAESYRALRTNIQFMSFDQNLKIVAITSSSPQEGKTSSSINLAVTVAQAGQKVLLVDSDFRKPMIGRVFGVENSPGLSDVVLGNFEWREVVRGIADYMTGRLSMDEVMYTPGLDNLQIMTSGTITPNPSELMGALRIKEFFDQAREEFDLIIVDTAPVLSATEAAMLASKIDGFVLVYKVGQVKRGALKRAKDQLDNVRANVLGVVLNGLKAEFSADFDDFDYYKYYYAYGSEDLGPRPRTGLERALFRLQRFFGLPWRRADKKTDRAEGHRPNKKKTGLKTMPWTLAAVLGLGLLLAGAYLLYQPWERDIASLVLGPKAPPPASPAQKVSKQLSRPAPAEPEKAEEAAPPQAQSAPAPETPARKTAPQSIALDRLAAKRDHAPGLGFALQTASYRQLEAAQAHQRQLEERGLETYISRVDLPGRGTWFRVFVGAFATQGEAASGLETYAGVFKQLRSEPRVVMMEYALTPANPENLDQGLVDQLAQAGLRPYLLGQGGPVLIGAFFTEAGARDMAALVRGLGLETRLARR